MSISDELITTFAPSGKLRAAINLGNPILANQDAATGRVYGLSVDLATAFAKLLKLELSLVVVDTAAKSVKVVEDAEADIGFFAIDPIRGENIAFTAPYVLIEGFYLVKRESPIRHNDEVDQASNKVVVGKGSAYDLFLSRELKHAQIARADSSPTVVSTFLALDAEVAAGVKQQLEADALSNPGLRLLDQRFMVIQQAMGVHKSRGSLAAEYLAQFVEQMKADGFVQKALEQHGIKGAAVAPLV